MNRTQLSGDGAGYYEYAPATPVSDRLPTSIANLLVISVFVFIALFLGQLALSHFKNPGRFPIRSVVVEGVYQFADQNQMRERVMTQASRGFFNLEIEDIRKEVEDLPWVNNAYVRRVWPESISVHVEEHNPVARWGDNELISDGFKLFSPPQLNGQPDAEVEQLVARLPHLHSPERRHVSLLKLLNETKHMLESVEAPLEGMTEDERRSLTLHLKNNVKVVIGHREVHERIDRFSQIFRSYVAPVYDDISKVDMRYTNGFAMARKSLASETVRVQ